MADYATIIDPDLHYIRCTCCNFESVFESISSLSRALSITTALYKDTQLVKERCPKCEQKTLEVCLKSEAISGPSTMMDIADSCSGSSSENLQESEALTHLGNSAGSGDFAEIKKAVMSQLFAVENRADLTEDQKVSRVQHAACTTCAGIAIQPIPFADIFILTPVQGLFASKIAAIRGVPLSENDAQEWTKQTIGLMGMGFLAQQLAIGVWKTVTFGAGGLLTIPLVYALTYGVMKTADVYFQKLKVGVKLSDDQIRLILKTSIADGKAEAAKHKAK